MLELSIFGFDTLLNSCGLFFFPITFLYFCSVLQLIQKGHYAAQLTNTKQMSPFSEKHLILSMKNKIIRPGAIVQSLGESYATNLQNMMSLWLAKLL